MKRLKLNSQLVNYLLLVAILLLLVLTLAGTNMVIGLLNKKANNLVAIKAQTQALSTEQTNLLLDKKEVQKYSSLEGIAQSIVPQDKNQAEAVREIVSIASQAQVPITQILFPLSSLGSAETSALTPVAPATSSSTLALSQLTAVKGIPGVYVLPIEVEDSIGSDAVTYANFYNFLTKLEQNRRTSLVNSLSLEPLPSNANLITFTLTIDEYIKPL